MNFFNLYIKIIFFSFFLLLQGCNGLMQDIFVGNPPSDEEAWYKKGMTRQSQTADFSECFKLSRSKYDINTEFNELYDFNQECLLGKGYKFYPRGLDGSKASRCTAGGDAGGPACQSLKNIRNR